MSPDEAPPGNGFLFFRVDNFPRHPPADTSNSSCRHTFDTPMRQGLHPEQTPMAETMYGSDKAGLVCGYVFELGQPGRAIDSDAAASHLGGPLEGTPEFLW